MSRDLQNICSRTKKKTRDEILKFESKKMRVELKKKITRVEKERTLTSCVVYRCLHFTDTSNLRKHPFLLLLVAGAVSRGIQVLVISLGFHFIGSS